MTLFNQSGQSKSAGDGDAPTVRPAGKKESDEAFPVASLLATRHRPVVRAFYRIVRMADDLADSSDKTIDQKLSGLQRYRQQAATDLPEQIAPYAVALIDAFAADCHNPPCPTWADTLASARRSSTPVGRMLLHLHDGDDECAGPASDALCTALQLLNHIGDAHTDQVRMNRSYCPQDWLQAAGQDQSVVLRRMLEETSALLISARPIVHQIKDLRLSFQAAVTLACAHTLSAHLKTRKDWRTPPHFGALAIARSLTHGLLLFLNLRWQA